VLRAEADGAAGHGARRPPLRVVPVDTVVLERPAKKKKKEMKESNLKIGIIFNSSYLCIDNGRI